MYVYILAKVFVQSVRILLQHLYQFGLGIIVIILTVYPSYHFFQSSSFLEGLSCRHPFPTWEIDFHFETLRHDFPLLSTTSLEDYPRVLELVEE